MDGQRFIVHVDMDAFFAAIEQRDNLSYRGKPVVVGADPKNGLGRGVVSTCSYEARKFGIHSAMPISQAFKYCPQAIFVRPDMAKYEAVSLDIFKIFYSFSPKVESISLDEAFIDITGSHHLFGGPQALCQKIKSQIKEEIGLSCSIGLAPIKMAAKIASDLKKPDGFVVVSEDKLLDFLWPLDVGKIWGLGEKTKQVLNSWGIKTISQLAKKDKSELIALFGKNGEHFWQLANGIDPREVEGDSEAKSISNELTFSQDTADSEKISSALTGLCEKVSRRLRLSGIKGKTITLKIRFSDFSTYTRAVTLNEATNFVDVLLKEIKILYNNFGVKKKMIRLIGVKVSNFSQECLQLNLFKSVADDKKEAIHNAVDLIKSRFGEDAIRRARVKLS